MITFQGFLYGRVVVKYGTNALAIVNENKEVLGLNRTVIGDIAHLGRIFYDRGIELIVVSSGAMVAAMKEEGLRHVPSDFKKRQDLATDGQQYLSLAYAEALKEQGMGLRGLILLTHHNLRTNDDRANLLERVERGFADRKITVLNTNDAVTNAELASKSWDGFSDNDPLAARVARYCKANSLIIVSEEGDLGSGGGNSKEKAFRYAERYGIQTNIGVRVTHRNIENLLEEWLPKPASIHVH